MGNKIDYLNELRKVEFYHFMQRSKFDFKNQKGLEIGSGTGVQLQEFHQLGIYCIGVEVEESYYRDSRLIEIKIYDGKVLPFPNHSFDFIFSSNVLEHIRDMDSFQQEIHRVLKPDGAVIHIMPTQYWKFWTVLTYYCAIMLKLVRKLFKINRVLSKEDDKKLCKTSPIQIKILKGYFCPRHGEKGNRFTEFIYFMPTVWKRCFKRNGWMVIAAFPLNLFYTGEHFFGYRISFKQRTFLSKLFGSSTFAYILKSR